MPKARSSILSSLRGSLKGGPTFRANPQTDAITMQQRPVPTGAPTAKQTAVRNAYARLAYLWSNLSTLDKEPYQIMAEAQDLTAWNCFLKFHMPLMRLTPKFYTACAEGAGSTVQNFAIDGITGTINGPVWQEKNGFNNLYFDGLDDRVIFSPGTNYINGNNYTFFLIVKTGDAYPSTCYLCGDRNSSGMINGLEFAISVSGGLILYWGNNIAPSNTSVASALPLNTCHVIGAIKDGSSVTFYYNGTTITKTNLPAVVMPSSLNWTVGRGATTSYPYKGNIYLASMIPEARTVADLAALDAHYRPFFE